MGTLWQFDSGDTHYSVRSSGASIRLYTNRVFHSQWNPGNPFSGGIWDCLSLPVFYRDRTEPWRVLLLGVGGGAVIQQLKRLITIDQLSAVEIDEHHLNIARRWFGINDEHVALIHDDAVNWLYSYDSEPYDLIIDDLFGHASGEPVRACELEHDWLLALYKNLKPDGLLIANCIDQAELRAAIPSFNDVGFRFGYRWSLSAYENVIAVFSRTSLHARDWSRNLASSGLNAAVQRQARSTQRKPIRGLGKLAR